MKAVSLLLIFWTSQPSPNLEQMERAAILESAEAALRGEFPLSEQPQRAEAIRQYFRRLRPVKKCCTFSHVHDLSDRICDRMPLGSAIFAEKSRQFVTAGVLGDLIGEGDGVAVQACCVHSLNDRLACLALPRQI